MVKLQATTTLCLRISNYESKTRCAQEFISTSSTASLFDELLGEFRFGRFSFWTNKSQSWALSKLDFNYIFSFQIVKMEKKTLSLLSSISFGLDFATATLLCSCVGCVNVCMCEIGVVTWISWGYRASYNNIYLRRIRCSWGKYVKLACWAIVIVIVIVAVAVVLLSM